MPEVTLLTQDELRRLVPLDLAAINCVEQGFKALAGGLEIDQKKIYSISDLRYLMERLRDPEIGCPWDIKQTYSSLKEHTLEEAIC